MRAFVYRKLAASLAMAGLLTAPLLATAATAKPAHRAYLGLAAEAAKADAQGVLVQSVDPQGPAGKAGLKNSDRIVMVDGKAVKSFEDLKKTLAGHKPGDALVLKVSRDGKEQSITVTLGAAPRPAEAAIPPAGKTGAFLGVHAQALTADLKEHLEVATDKGALVTDVLPESPAARAGLHADDVITHVGDQAIGTPEELRDAIRKSGAGKDVALKVVRGTKKMDVKARLETIPAGTPTFHGLPAGVPEGFGQFSDQFRPFFSGMEKVPALEKKLQELENRVHELEQKAAK
jgi:S1-C subfamily serine protease